jgi:uncharacterized repeat protein (TIGR01451 family)
MDFFDYLAARGEATIPLLPDEYPFAAATRGRGSLSMGVLPACGNARDKTADLAITQSVRPEAATQGRNRIFTLTVLNRGPQAAEYVRLYDLLPPEATLVSARGDDGRGRCSGSSLVVCTLRTLNPQDTWTVNLTVTFPDRGGMDHTVGITSCVHDRPLSNNRDTMTVHPRDLVVDSSFDGVAASDAQPGDGVCADGRGGCSLRAAIEEANAIPGRNRITFANAMTIAVDPNVGALPTVTGQTIIDASGVWDGVAGRPGVTLNGRDGSFLAPRLDADYPVAPVLGRQGICGPGSPSRSARGRWMAGLNAVVSACRAASGFGQLTASCATGWVTRVADNSGATSVESAATMHIAAKARRARLLGNCMVCSCRAIGAIGGTFGG